MLRCGKEGGMDGGKKVYNEGGEMSQKMRGRHGGERGKGDR